MFYLVLGSGSVSSFNFPFDDEVWVPCFGTGVPRPEPGRGWGEPLPESGVPLLKMPDGNIGLDSIPCCKQNNDKHIV